MRHPQRRKKGAKPRVFRAEKAVFGSKTGRLGVVKAVAAVHSPAEALFGGSRRAAGRFSAVCAAKSAGEALC